MDDKNKPFHEEEESNWRYFDYQDNMEQFSPNEQELSPLPSLFVDPHKEDSSLGMSTMNIPQPV